MLAISTIKSAGAAAQYYAKEDYFKPDNDVQDSQDDGKSPTSGGAVEYYSKDETAAGDRKLTWGGAGAELLGLEGEVDPEDLRAVLNGINPNGDDSEALSKTEELLRGRVDKEAKASALEASQTNRADEPTETAPDGLNGPPTGEREAHLPVGPLGASGEPDGSTPDGGKTGYNALGVPERVELAEAYKAERQALGEDAAQVRHGWDMTFNAPKSVSVAALGDDGDKRLVEAFDKSVEMAMKYAEDNFSVFRFREDGEVQHAISGNLVYATTGHELSRAGDKHLHRHNAVANATMGEDGKWHALETKHLFQAKKLIGAVQQAYLRSYAHELGYNTRDGDTEYTFELEGISRATIDISSERKEQIDSKMAELDAKGRALTEGEKILASRQDRPDKTKLTYEELNAKWADKESGTGFSVKEFVDAAKERAKGVDVDSHAPSRLQGFIDKVRDIFAGPQRNLNSLHDSLSHAIEAVFSRTTVTTPHEIILEAAKVNGNKYTVEQYITSDIWKASPFIEASKNTLQGITRPDAIQTERFLIKHAEAMKGRASGFSPELVESALRPEMQQAAGLKHEMTEGQYNAAFKILTSTDGVLAVQGTAGAGKTTSFAATQYAFQVLTMVDRIARERNGANAPKVIGAFKAAETKTEFDELRDSSAGLLGAAPTHSARSELNERQIQTTTLSSLQMRYEFAKSQNRSDKFDKLRLEYSGSWLVIDETSMIGNDQAKKLFQMQKDLRIEKMIWTGDERQIASHSAGAPFSMLMSRVNNITSRIEQVVRTNVQELQQTISLFAEGKATAALQNIKGFIHEVGAQKAGGAGEKTDVALADKTIELWEKDGRTAKIVVVTNAMRGMINSRVRDSMERNGELSGPGYQQPTLVSLGKSLSDRVVARLHTPGTVLHFHGDSGEFKRGENYIVDETDQRKRVNKLVVHNEKTGEIKEIDLSKLDLKKGDVKFDVYRKSESIYKTGDVIVFSKGNKDLGVAARQDYKIVSMTDKDVSFAPFKEGKKLDPSKAITMDKDDDSLRFSGHGYGITADLAQGGTWSRVIMVWATRQGGDFINAARGYIGASRPSHDFKMVVDSFKSMIMKVGENSGMKAVALDNMGRRLTDVFGNDEWHQRQKASFEKEAAAKKKTDPIEKDIIQNDKSLIDPKKPEDAIAKAAGAQKPTKDNTYKTNGEKDIGDKAMTITKERERGR